MITPLVTGLKPGALAVTVVVPGVMPVSATPSESHEPARHVPVGATVAAEGTELVKVTAMGCAGVMLLPEYVAPGTSA